MKRNNTQPHMYNGFKVDRRKKISTIIAEFRQYLIDEHNVNPSFALYSLEDTTIKQGLGL